MSSMSRSFETSDSFQDTATSGVRVIQVGQSAELRDTLDGNVLVAVKA